MRPSIRASELDRVLRCPGSLTLCAIVEHVDRDDGHEGTLLHWMIAQRAIDELGAVPPEGGLPPPDVPKDFKLSPFSGWIVDWALRLIRERIPADWSLMVEVPFATSFDRWENTGHADIVAISADGAEAIGIDWKSGRDPIEPAETNEQFADYILHIKAAWSSVQKATFIGAQPRISEDEEDEDGPERITEVTLEGDMLERLAPTMDARVGVALDRPMLLDDGRIQCRWCSAATQCAAIKRTRDSMQYKMTSDELAAIRAKPPAATLADWVVASKLLAQPLKDAREMAKERIAEQGSLTATDGTVITQEVSKGSYKILRPIELWTTISGLLSETGRAMCARWSTVALKKQIAKEMNIPQTGKAAVTAESVFDAQIRSHLEQGEKVTFQFR